MDPNLLITNTVKVHCKTENCIHIRRNIFNCKKSLMKPKFLFLLLLFFGSS